MRKEEEETWIGKGVTTAAVDVVPEVKNEDCGEGREKPNPKEPEMAVEDTRESGSKGLRVADVGSLHFGVE